MGKPQIAVRVPPSLLAELNQYVEKTGTSKTDLVVSAIAQYLGCAESVPLTQDLLPLAGLFKLFADQVECVVLNACYAKVQAEAIALNLVAFGS